MKLSQFDAAEEALSKSLGIITAIFPHDHDQIFRSKTTIWNICCEQ